ncbi:hypothetical protein MIR68_006245 [Amoeboaphelidium protococcarum]|nr:hypothetical protein MIR68_006245 [Amoeboaphelidium protococcarum]
MDDLRIEATQYIKELNKVKVEAAQDLTQRQMENKEVKHVINQLDEEIKVEKQALEGLQTELRQLQMTPNAFQHRTEEEMSLTRKLKADYSETHILMDQTRHLGEHETMSHIFGSWQRAKS